MTDDLRIIIQTRLDTSANAIKNLDKDINTLAQNVTKLKLSINIDDANIKNLTQKIEVIQKQVGKGIRIFDADHKLEGTAFTSIDEAIKKYSALGQVLVNKTFDPATKHLTGFNIQLTKADGLIQKLQFNAAKLSDGKDTIDIFKLDKITELDKTQEILEKQLQLKQQTELKIEKIEQESLAKKQKIKQEYENWWLKTLKEREIAEARLLNKNNDDKSYYLAHQENQRRELDYLSQKEKMIAKIQDMQRRFGADNKASKSLSSILFDAENVSAIGNYRKAFSDLDVEIKKVGASVHTAGSHMMGFGEQMKIALTRFPIWMASSTIFFQSLHFFTKGVEYVNDLNKSLTQISIVTGKNQQEVAALGHEYNSLAKEMGVTTKQIAQASVEFYRQGLSQEEVMERVKVATQYAKISNIEFKDAAEILTATTNSMNVSAEKASDVFAYLGDATATGADEIGRAFQKVGGTAGALNLEFEKVSSWIAVLSSRTREGAETIGQSIKSILARVQNMRENGFDEEDGTKINDVAKALATVGIQIVDSKGQFVDFGNTMDLLGERWGTLDSRTKAYIATTVAGTYQQSRFLNLMEGYKDTIPLYEKALQSAGSTTQKFSLYQEGTEASLDRLKASMEGLWQNSFKSDEIRGVIDLLNGIVSIMSKLSNTFGTIPSIIGLATGAVLTFNSTLRSNALTFFGVNLQSVALATQIFTGSTVAARAAVIGLQASMTLGLSLAITGITMGITKLISHQQKLKEEQKQLEQQNQTIVKSWTTQKDKINELINQYQSLDSTKNRTTEQDQKYLEITNELSKLMPNLVASIDEKGNAHLKNRDAIKEELVYADKLAKLEQGKNVASAKDDFSTLLKNKKELESELKDLQEKINRGVGRRGTSTGNALSGTGGLSAGVKQTEADLKSLEIQALSTETQISAATSSIKEKMQSLVSTIASLEGVQISESTAETIKKIISSLDVSKFNPDEMIAKSKQLVELIQLIQSPKTNRSQVGISENQFNNLAKSMGLTTEQANLLKVAIKGVSEESSKTSSVNDLLSLQQKLTSTFETTSKALSPLNDAIDKLKNGHALTSDQITELLKKYPDLFSAFTVENGQLKITVDALEAKRDAEIKTMETALQSEQKQVDAQEQALISKLAMYVSEIDAIKSVADAKRALAEESQKIDQQMADYIEENGGAVGGAFAEFLNQKTKLDDLGKQADTIQKAKDSIQALQNAAKVGFNFETTNDKPASNSKNTYINKLFQDLPEYKERAEDLQSQLKTLNSTITDVENAISLADKTNDANTKLQKEQELNDLLQHRKDKYHEIAEALRTMRDGEMSTNFNSNFGDLAKGRNFSDIPKEEIKKYTDQLEQEMVSLENQIGNSVSETVKVSLEKAKTALSDKKDLLSFFVSTFDDIGQSIESQSSAWISDNEKQLDLQKSMRQSYFDQSEKWIADEITRLTIAGHDEISIAKMVLEARKRMADEKWATERRISKLTADEQLKADKAVFDASKELSDKLKAQAEDLASKIVETYKEVYEAQKEAELDGIDASIKAEDKRHQNRLDNIDDEYERFEKAINDQIQLIDRESDTEDFNSNLTKLQKEESDIRSKIDKLSLDDSASAQVKRKELEEELSEKLIEIEKMKNERTKELRKQDLQDQLDKKKEQVDAQKDAEDKLNEINKEALEKYRDIREKYWEGVINNDAKFLQLQKDVIAGNFTDILTDLDNFKTEVSKIASVIGTEIEKNIVNKIGGVTGEIKNSQSYNPLGMSSSDFNTYLNNKKDYENGVNMAQAAKQNQELRTKYGIASDNYTYEQLKKLAGFDTGGLTPAWGNTGKLAFLHEKELVLNKIDTSNILKAVEFTRDFVSQLKMPDFSNIIPKLNPVAAGNTIINMNVNIDKLTGDKSGAKTFFTEIERGLQKRGL